MEGVQKNGKDVDIGELQKNCDSPNDKFKVSFPGIISTNYAHCSMTIRMNNGLAISVHVFENA